MASKGGYKQDLRAIVQVFSQKNSFLLLLGLYPLVLWLFVYMTNLNLFLFVLRSGDLTFASKLDFMWQALLNIFRYIGDPLATSIIIFSFLATINLVLIIYVIRQRRKIRRRGQAAAALAVFGSHCVACGGSLLAPIVTAMVGSGAYISASRANATTLLALSINLVAIAIILYATLRSARALHHPNPQ